MFPKTRKQQFLFEFREYGTVLLFLHTLNLIFNIYCGPYHKYFCVNFQLQTQLLKTHKRLMVTEFVPGSEGLNRERITKIKIWVFFWEVFLWGQRIFWIGVREVSEYDVERQNIQGKENLFIYMLTISFLFFYFTIFVAEPLLFSLFLLPFLSLLFLNVSSNFGHVAFYDFLIF